MSKLLLAIQALTSFVGVGLWFTFNYLLLQHIKASEFLWFFFGAVIVAMLITNATSLATKNYDMRKQIEKYFRELKNRRPAGAST